MAATVEVVVRGMAMPYTITALTPLPSWLTLIPLIGGGNPAGSQTLTGFAQSPGPVSFTLRVQDSLGNFGVRTFTLTVAPFAVFTNNGATINWHATESGSFEVRKLATNKAGTDTFRARAVNGATGESCVGVASI